MSFYDMRKVFLAVKVKLNLDITNLTILYSNLINEYIFLIPIF